MKKITKVYYQDEDYKICRVDSGIRIYYNFKDEMPAPWLEYHMKIMTWHILDNCSTFSNGRIDDGYWYIDVNISGSNINNPPYKFW